MTRKKLHDHVTQHICWKEASSSRSVWKKKDNSIISYEQARKSPASFHLLSGVNLDIPLVSIKLNVIETMNTDLLRH